MGSARLKQLRQLLAEHGYGGFLATGRSNQLTFIDHPDPTSVLGWPGG